MHSKMDHHRKTRPPNDMPVRQPRKILLSIVLKLLRSSWTKIEAVPPHPGSATDHPTKWSRQSLSPNQAWTQIKIIWMISLSSKPCELCRLLHFHSILWKIFRKWFPSKFCRKPYIFLISYQICSNRKWLMQTKGSGMGVGDTRAWNLKLAEACPCYLTRRNWTA